MKPNDIIPYRGTRYRVIMVHPAKAFVLLRPVDGGHSEWVSLGEIQQGGNSK